MANSKSVTPLTLTSTFSLRLTASYTTLTGGTTVIVVSTVSDCVSDDPYFCCQDALNCSVALSIELANVNC